MFCMKSLLMIVALAALGTAGLIYRTQIWASTLVALTLGVVLFAGCRACFVPKSRPFWGPFAVTGALYLAIVSLQPLAELHYNLPTTQLITYGLEKLQTPTVMQGTAVYPGGTAYGALEVTPSVTVLPVPGTGASPYAYSLPNAGIVGSMTFERDVLFRMATNYGATQGFSAEARAFLWVAQCLWCLLVAFAMGMTCSWLSRSVKSTATA